MEVLACKRTGLATSCVFDCHIGPNIFTSQICILLLRIRVASSHPRRIFAPSHLRSGFSYLTFSYPHIVASQIFVSCIVASASHLRIFASQILTSQIFSYPISLSSSGLHILKHILSSQFWVFMTWSHCPILSRSSRFHYHIFTT